MISLGEWIAPVLRAALSRKKHLKASDHDYHEPVLLTETVEALAPAPGKIIVSMDESSVGERARRALEACRKPTIAMIQGWCIGGGVGIALSCDLRIASDDSRFGVPAAWLGIGYGYAGVARLADIVGPSFAKEIFYTARHFDAGEALRMGLVNRVLPTAELEAYVRDYAGRIGANAPLSIAAVKCCVDEYLKDPAERDLAACQAAVDACARSADYVEGRTAFMEKRKPVFSGK